MPKFFERRRVVISSPLNPRLRMTSSCFGKRACSIVSSQPSYCIRSASVLPMMPMCSPVCSRNGSAAWPAGAVQRSHRRQPPIAPIDASCVMSDSTIRRGSTRWLQSLPTRLSRSRDLECRRPAAATRLQAFGRIGESHPARSAGFTPLTKPPKVKVVGLDTDRRS